MDQRSTLGPQRVSSINYFKIRCNEFTETG